MGPMSCCPPGWDSSKVPVPAVKVPRLVKSTGPEATFKVLLLKTSPPAVAAKEATLWVRDEPRSKVPLSMDSAPAVRLLPAMAVPPFPFWEMAG